MSTLFFITGNKGKVAEIQEKTKKISLNIVQKNIGYPEIQADTLEEVVHSGLKYIKNKISSPFILEDAGIFNSSRYFATARRETLIPCSL